jgi:hypothetical protein
VKGFRNPMTLFKNNYRIESARLKGWDYTSARGYFVTFCTRDRQPFLGKVTGADVRLSPIGEIVAEEWLHTPHVRPNVELDEGIIMPNHVHGIIIITQVPYDYNPIHWAPSSDKPNPFAPNAFGPPDFGIFVGKRDFTTASSVITRPCKPSGPTLPTISRNGLRTKTGPAICGCRSHHLPVRPEVQRHKRSLTCMAAWCRWPHDLQAGQ